MGQRQDLETGLVSTSLTYVVHLAIGRDLETPNGRASLHISPVGRAYLCHLGSHVLFNSIGLSKPTGAAAWPA